MKRRAVEHLIRDHIAPNFPHLRQVGDLLVRWEPDLILRGFVFERSFVDATALRVAAFVQPLFVPTDSIVLDMSERLASCAVEDGKEEAVMTAALTQMRRSRLLERVRDARSLAVLAVPGSFPMMYSGFASELRAYCWIYAGERERAELELSELASALSSGDPLDQEILGRMSEVHDALRVSSDRARALLDAWGSRTAAALRLPGAGS